MGLSAFALWTGLVCYLIESAGADPDAITFDFEQIYENDWGALDAARKYLSNLQSQKNCSNN